MGHLKQWRQIGQAHYLKWEEKGQALEGIWQGTQVGRFGDLGLMDTPEGRISIALHTVLHDRLSEVKIGAEVRLVYTGIQTAQKSGRQFKGFEVYVASAEDLLPEPSEEVPPF